jgi:hypothetical protein
MSDSSGLVAVYFLGAFAFVATIYIANAANRLGGQIATGMIQGTPIAVETRRTMLLHIWIHHETGGIALSVFTAVAALEIARHVAGTGTELVANLFAFIAIVAAIMWLLAAAVMFFHYRGLLRQAEAD